MTVDPKIENERKRAARDGTVLAGCWWTYCKERPSGGASPQPAEGGFS